MARPRPRLERWNDDQLRELKIATPKVWVSTVLSSLTARKADRGEELFGRWYRSWTFGEVREAIRRELERRGTSPTRAAELSSLRTTRGLKELQAGGALNRVRAGYRLKEEWVWRQLVQDAIEKCVTAIESKKWVLRVELVPRRKEKGHRVRFTVTRRGKATPRLEIGWVV